MSFWRSRRVLWICGAVLVLILLLWRPGADRFRSRLEQSLSAALGHKVDIGSVSLQILPRPGFNLSQLSVHDDPQFSLEPILRADEVSATLHPSSLWRWRIEIANLTFRDASLNLVRRADGRWNLEPLLERAAHVPAAPTGNATAEVRRRFPYIEVTGSRVNLKLGAEKMPYALTDADLALFLSSADEWGMRLRGQPVRTDMRLSDTGTLRASATWRRAVDLRKTPLRLTATYDGAQLGQVTKLLYGADKGWRGTVGVSAILAGSAEDLEIQTETTVDGFRRYDLLSGSALRLAAQCSARYSISPAALSQILCSTPARDGSLLLRGKIELVRPPVYDLNLNAAKFPAERLAEILRSVKKGLPTDLSATGAVSADLSFAANGDGPPVWSGSGSTDDLILTTVALRSKDGPGSLSLGTVPFRATASTAPAKTKTRKPRDRSDQNAKGATPGNRLEIGPAHIDLRDHSSAGPQPATFSAWFSPGAYSADFEGDGTVQRLLQLARAAGATLVHPAVEGDAQFEWHAAGEWGGFAPPQTQASIHLRNVRAEFPGLNAPVTIVAGDVTLTPDSFRLEKLAATAGGIRWSGSLSRPRVCPGPELCPTQIDLQAEEVTSDKLNELLNPNVHKQPWYQILTGGPQQSTPELSTLSAVGNLKVIHFSAGDLDANNVAAKLRLENGHLHLTEVRAAVLGGTHIGEWQCDFSKDPPEYTITGVLDHIALPQLKTAKTNWVTGTARVTYALNLAGWTPKEVQSSSRGTFTVDAQDGVFPHFGPSAGPLKFARLRGELTTGKALVVVSSGELENPQGTYVISGVASMAHKLDLKMLKKDGHGLTISGTLEEPRVEAITPPAPLSARN